MLWPMILSNLGLMGCNWGPGREVAADPRKESIGSCGSGGGVRGGLRMPGVRLLVDSLFVTLG